MALNAELSIDTTDVSGDSANGGNDVHEILVAVKEIRDILAKNTKLQQSGFIGTSTSSLLEALGLDGFAGAGIGTLGTLGAGLGAVLATPGDQPNGSTPLGYDRGRTSNGQDVYFEIDNKTGDLLNVLTKQQAEDKGILDEKGNIRQNLQTQSPLWKETTEKMKRYRDEILLTNDNLDNIKKETDDQKRIAAEITKALNDQLKSAQGINFKATGQNHSNDYNTPTSDGQVPGPYNNVYLGNGPLTPVGIIQNGLNNYNAQRQQESDSAASIAKMVYDRMPIMDPVSYIQVKK